MFLACECGVLMVILKFLADPLRLLPASGQSPGSLEFGKVGKLEGKM